MCSPKLCIAPSIFSRSLRGSRSLLSSSKDPSTFPTAFSELPLNSSNAFCAASGYLNNNLPNCSDCSLAALSSVFISCLSSKPLAVKSANVAAMYAAMACLNLLGPAPPALAAASPISPASKAFSGNIPLTKRSYSAGSTPSVLVLYLV